MAEEKCVQCGGSGRDALGGRCNYCQGTGRSGCFSGATKVLAECGWCRIDNVKVGQKVLTFIEETGSFELAVVKRFQKHTPRRVTRVTFNGGFFESTENHPILTEKGWIRAGRLKEGDQMINNSYGYTKVRESKLANKPQKVYNLVVQNGYSYVVSGGVIASSFVYCRATRVKLARWIDQYITPTSKPYAFP